MAMFYIRRVETPEGLVMVLVTDEDVMERAVYDEERGVRIIVSRSFYGGSLGTEADAIKTIEKADIIVLTGEKSVSIGVRMGLVNPDSVLEVKGIKQVQVFKFSY
ncbi:conserved hypothetical protein [Aeropyrum pernix K1]|uniref:DUF424 domain-containing protein n=2 Tax=Aeropyrum pernix TaxID=56636 RepID=Q9YFW8_AERPE|nr:conserved hypothetical protein [Aeropyrum pernix K1]